MRVRSELGGFTNSHLTFFFHVSQDLRQAGTRSEHLLVIDFRFGRAKPRAIAASKSVKQVC